MKNLFTVLFVSIAFIITGCGSDQETHSHGEDGDHTHEAPGQQSTSDGDAVRIGGGDQAADHDSTHAHGEDADHSHEEDTHSHGDEEHSH